MVDTATPPHLSCGRLQERLAELSAIGGIDGTSGSCRLALTDEDKHGRDLVVRWMTDLGLDVSVDRVGNVVAVQPGFGERAPVLCGSHIDTVRTGGRYDGNLGVLAGLEIIEHAVTTGIALSRPLGVAFFSDEEGARYAPDMLGSLVYVGGMSSEEALDTVGIDGTRYGDELERIGYAGAAPTPGLVPHAFVELHIEQGPVLEAEATTIGAVTGVQGISWQEVTITGQSNHAGTTPMSMRRDPAYVAGRIAVGVRDIAVALGGSQVATVGRIEARPNLVNVVPAEVALTVDLRNTDEGRLRDAEEALGRLLDELAEAEDVDIEVRTLARFEPVIFDPDVVSLVESSARELGLSVRTMPSGAGHDAQMLARVCPTGMVFVPSEGGLSHNPAEHTEPSDIEAGVNVLFRVMCELAS